MPVVLRQRTRESVPTVFARLVYPPRRAPGDATAAFSPPAVEFVFNQITRLMETSSQIAMTAEDLPYRVTARHALTGSPVYELGHRYLPVEVRRITLASPLEIVLALSGAFASPSVLRAFVDLVAHV